MKTRKILFSLSAILLSLYTIWEIVRQTPLFKSWYYEHISGNSLLKELIGIPYTWLFLGGVLLALIASLVKTNESKPVSQTYKYGTYILSLLAFFITAWGVVHAVYYYLYVPAVLRIVVAIFGCIWLWMLAFRPSNQQLPKSLRSFIGLGIGLIGLLWVLQLVSGIAYLTTGHLLMFRTHVIGNWLRFLVPTVLLCSYSLYLLDKWPSQKINEIRQTRNSHCTPFSLVSRAYPAMRIIPVLSMAVLGILIYCQIMWMNTFILYEYTPITGQCLVTLVGISWLLLTFMAFFQLPNPRSYRIFNWAFLVLNICFPVGVFLTIYFDGNEKLETIGEVIGVIGLFAIIFYLLFTVIRVILYTIPESE